MCLALALGAGSASLAFSQAVSATMVGTVTDATGAVVANARVTLTETNTGVAHSLFANPSGNYTFANIPPGRYQVTVEMPGFKKEVRDAIDVDVDSTARVDVQLQPGNVSETIEVSAAPPPLKTDRADITTTVDNTQIEELPLWVNGNFQTLLTLVPGTTDPTFQHSQFFNASSSVQMNTNGQFRMANNYQIEGIDNNERTGLLQILIPPKEAIQQVDVSVSNHDPELGRGTGAVTNVILKSGTNKYHGGVYWNLQNSDLDTRSFFNPAVGHVAYNQVGGNLGGPIKHNKLFFFGDYLRTMDHEDNTNQTTIPSAAFRAGNFSGDTHIVYDPATGIAGDPNGKGRTPFPGNIVPASRINPASAAIFAMLPPTNEPLTSSQANDYFALLPATKTTDHFDVKIDDQLTGKDRVSGRFSFERPVIYQAPEFGGAGGPAQGAFEGTGVQRTYSSGLNWDRIVSPTLIAQTRFGVAYYNNIASQTDYGKDDATAIGALGVNINPFTSGMVGINLGGYSSPLVGYSASLPWVRSEANIDFVNTWTKMAHNHTIKWGVDIRRIRDALLQDQTFSPRGVVYFGANQTSVSGASMDIGNDVASMLLDVPKEIGRDVNTYFPALRATQVFAFVGDRWQVSPRFTLDLGLRWELYPPFTPQFPGGFSNYNPLNNTLVIGGVGGNPGNLGMETHYHYFAPRTGVAYRLTNSTVLRSGFGLSYTSFPDNNYAYNFPVRSNNEYLPRLNATFTPVILPSGEVGTFQAGFPPPDPVVVPANGIITNPDPTSAYFYIPKNFKNPYVMQWNIAVQQALPFHLVLDVAYVGSHGVDTIAAVNLNAGLILGAAAAGQPEFATYGRTTSTTQYFRGFSSTFNALEARFDRRFSSGVHMTSSFTWQHALDYQSGDDGGLADWYIGEKRNYARADFDHTLNFVQSYVYLLPFGKGQRFATHGPAAAVMGGWQVSGILTMRTGGPFTITSGVALNAPGNTETPNQIAPIQVLHGINTGNPWFDKTSFSQPATNTFGAMGRNVMSGPGEFRLDGAVSRWINWKERYRMQIRGEAINLTNTPYFKNPAADYSTTSSFTYVTGTVGSGVGVNGFSAARSIQLALKILF